MHTVQCNIIYPKFCWLVFKLSMSPCKMVSILALSRSLLWQIHVRQTSSHYRLQRRQDMLSPIEESFNNTMITFWRASICSSCVCGASGSSRVPWEMVAAIFSMLAYRGKRLIYSNFHKWKSKGGLCRRQQCLESLPTCKFLAKAFVGCQGGEPKKKTTWSIKNHILCVSASINLYETGQAVIVMHR